MHLCGRITRLGRSSSSAEHWQRIHEVSFYVGHVQVRLPTVEIRLANKGLRAQDIKTLAAWLQTSLGDRVTAVDMSANRMSGSAMMSAPRGSSVSTMSCAHTKTSGRMEYDADITIIADFAGALSVAVPTVRPPQPRILITFDSL